MVAYEYGLVSPEEEDATHNVSRLLNVEARPYQRLAGRATHPEALLFARPRQHPMPPPDVSAADEEAAAKAIEREQENFRWQKWQNNMLLEIGLIDSTYLRASMTSTSNHQERERYRTEKSQIEDLSDGIRKNTEQLRAELVASRNLLEERKVFDKATEKILTSKVLKTRDEQALAHAKLDEEIAELNQEIASFKGAWAARRAQFGQILEEGRQMVKGIKEEKEEAERKEGMMKDDDEMDVSTTKGEVSNVGTPRPDVGGITPIPGHGDEGSTLLKVPQGPSSLSRANSVAPSPAKSGVNDTLSYAEPGSRMESDGELSIEEGEEMDET